MRFFPGVADRFPIGESGSDKRFGSLTAGRHMHSIRPHPPAVRWLRFGRERVQAKIGRRPVLLDVGGFLARMPQFRA